MVDAGGKGFVRMLEGVVRYIEGDPILPLADADGSGSAAVLVPAAAVEIAAERDFQFCTEVLVRGEQLPPANEVRAAMHAFGGSVVVAVIGGHPQDPCAHRYPGGRLYLCGPLGTGGDHQGATICGPSTGGWPTPTAGRSRWSPTAPPIWPTACSTGTTSRSCRCRWSSATRPSATGSSSSRRSSTGGCATARDLPTTSQPTPAEFVRVLRDARSGGGRGRRRPALGQPLGHLCARRRRRCGRPGSRASTWWTAGRPRSGVGMLALRGAELAESGWPGARDRGRSSSGCGASRACC